MGHVKKWPHICVVCGEPFIGHKFQVACSVKCGRISMGRKNSKKLSAAEPVDADTKNRLAARDYEYARAFPHMSGGSVRGRVPGGCHTGVYDNKANDMMRRFTA